MLNGFVERCWCMIEEFVEQMSFTNRPQSWSSCGERQEALMYGTDPYYQDNILP